MLAGLFLGVVASFELETGTNMLHCGVGVTAVILATGIAV
jgi:hypothetical protein